METTQVMQPILSDELEDLNIEKFTPVASPADIKREVPMTEKAIETVRRGRSAIRKILRGEDKRLLVITGPCSIHDPKAALEYAERLKALSDAVSDELLLVMRVYFEPKISDFGAVDDERKRSIFLWHMQTPGISGVDFYVERL